MRVLVFAPFGICEYHFETDLEIAQQHLAKGDHVTLAVCDADLPVCEFNNAHDVGGCIRCVGRRREGIERLTPKPDVVPMLRLSEADRAELRALSIDGLRSLEDLRELRIENFDIGWAVYSSIVSNVAGRKFDFEANRQTVAARLHGSLAVYRSMLRLIEELKIDRVYTFNGRLATMRAALRAAQARGVDCLIHERGSTFEKFSLFENHMPHELDYYQDLIAKTWETADPELREEIAQSYFGNRISGSVGNWVSFVAQQDHNLLPDRWKPRRNNVAVFTTSSDEVDAVADYLVGTLYQDQYEGLSRIFATVHDDPETHFYVRIHPRTQFVEDSGADRLLRNPPANVTVIPGNSAVSTYTLMRKVARVITFGSTTGIEAAYWGVPSILGMRSFYDRLGSTYSPGSHDEMMALVLDPNLARKDRLGALKWGYHEKMLGVPFRYYRPAGLTGGTFKDRPLKSKLAFRSTGWLLEHSGSVRDACNRIHLRFADRRLLGT
jgi:hypothetical protein